MHLTGPRAAGRPLAPRRAAHGGPPPRRQAVAGAPRAAAAGAPAGGGKNVVVIGGGWAGFGAAKHLAEQGYDVTLLEASLNPGGLSGGFRTREGKVVEAGMKGFWYEYGNIFSLLRELDIPWPLTDWTTSGFWSPKGLTTEAPVFSRQQQLPTLVGQFVHTAGLHWSIPLQERLSMLPFLTTLLDYKSSPETFERYDRMSARDLAREWGMSKRMYDDFFTPTLAVGLFAPPEDLSAAVTLETLEFYALGHQNSFDVCWPKGPISELIFQPLVKRIEAAGGRIRAGRLVTGFESDPLKGGAITAVTARDVASGAEESFPADAVVSAIGVTGFQKLVTASPLLAARPELRAAMNLRAIDCVALRLWFDKKVDCRFPANVLAGFERTAGATFFDLNALQDEYRDAPGSVITVDFYGASELLPLSDDELVARAAAHIGKCEPGFRGARVVDSAVLRFRKAVTHFSPGSLASRPFQATGVPNLFLAGDWVKGLDHGANGLSQERAYVTGLTAANLVVGSLGHGAPAPIVDVERAEPHIAAGREVVAALRGAVEGLGLKSPFL
ncbi:amine oxidase [Raphidocelis subcapitata]|uniref:Amine oxidase n=1 Tax=Raphidocelis subcapitata TaxID=307507 RepID=A0A2V0PJV9_9CHLO|nr:amine oxidase [Raphidocelis subcapitata]|eukprot:GBF97597.1 amine oxidase [Raphidocelis subcapitata]